MGIAERVRRMCSRGPTGRDWNRLTAAQLLAEPDRWQPMDAITYLCAAIPPNQRRELTPQRSAALRAILTDGRSRPVDLIVVAGYLAVPLAALLDRETGLLTAYRAYLAASYGDDVTVMWTPSVGSVGELEELKITIAVLDSLPRRRRRRGWWPL